MSTGRTTDDRDLDSKRHRETTQAIVDGFQAIQDGLREITRRLDAIEHHTRTPAPGHRPPPGLPWGDVLWCDMEERWTRTADRNCSCNDETGCTYLGKWSTSPPHSNAQSRRVERGC